MKSSEGILTDFYKGLLAKGIDQLITGRIYKSRPTFEDQKENIGINVLTNFNGYPQTGIINLNLYLTSEAANQPDLTRAEILAEQITDLLKEGQYGDLRYQIDNETGVMPDQDQDRLFYKNYRFNFQIIQ